MSTDTETPTPDPTTTLAAWRADHAVTLEWTGLTPWTRFACNAPADALCHAVWSCDCEAWTYDGVTDGVPWHSQHDVDDPMAPTTERHVGQLDPEACGLRDWFDGAEGENLAGSVTIPVRPSWTRDEVTFEPVDAMPRLLAFAEAVLALHRPVEWYRANPETGGLDEASLDHPLPPFCRECTDDEYVSAVEFGDTIDLGSPVVPWPCRTAALAEHLGGEGQ